MKQNVAMRLSNPINFQLLHHSCIQLEELPPNLVSHPHLIFRNKWDITYFLFFLTFSYHWQILYEPHCQCCWVKFTHAGHVILQLILYKVWYEAKCCYEISNPINSIFPNFQLTHAGHVILQLIFTSCIWILKELPPNLVSHPHLIFRNKWDIKHFLFFLTFSSPMLVMSFCN